MIGSYLRTKKEYSFYPVFEEDDFSLVNSIILQESQLTDISSLENEITPPDFDPKGYEKYLMEAIEYFEKVNFSSNFLRD